LGLIGLPGEAIEKIKKRKQSHRDAAVGFASSRGRLVGLESVEWKKSQPSGLGGVLAEERNESR
jgi:hypothetical protein